MPLRIRRTNPPRHKSYQRYKPYLREDFAYACVYCSIHENEAGGPRFFSVEHFRPKSRFPQLLTEYTNLFYACSVCNSYKSDDWPSENPVDDGHGYLDPCLHDYDEHFAATDDHRLVGRSKVATYMIERLHLNRGLLRKIRRLRREDEELHHQFVELFERNIELIEANLRERSLGKKKRAEFERDLERLRRQYEQRLAAWARRWEPVFALEDY